MFSGYKELLELCWSKRVGTPHTLTKLMNLVHDKVTAKIGRLQFFTQHRHASCIPSAYRFNQQL